MKTAIFNLLLAGFISATVLTGCSKSEAINDLNANSQNNSQNLSTTNGAAGGDMNVKVNLVNEALAIIYARDGGADITSQFKDFGFEFRAVPETANAGKAFVWNDILAQEGSWSMKGANTEFTIYYPTDLFPQLSFLNRTWTIGESGSAVLRLVAADGDEVQFARK